MKCNAKYTASDIANDVQSGTVPLCQRPRNKKAKISSGRKSVGIDTAAAAKEVPPPIERRVSLRRAASSSSTTSTKSSCNYAISMQKGLCSGVIKPNVTFFGEKLSNDVGCKLQRDSEKADALIIMGTSLSVAPMSRVVEYLKEDIPRILINRNIVRVRKAASKKDGDCLFHACLLGNCGTF
jgi:NAD-dependent SIR2 family protein deacetylase